MSSIADGHIRLTPGLKALGVNPPLDPQNSLTRIGIGSRKEIRDHRSKAMQKVAARLRIDVTSALDAVKLNSSTAEVAHANRQLAAWRSALSQDPLRPLPLHEQVVLLFVAAAYHDDPIVAEALKGGRDSLILRHMRSYSQPVRLPLAQNVLICVPASLPLRFIFWRPANCSCIVSSFWTTSATLAISPLRLRSCWT